jgi:hypothetical protein
MLTLGKNLKMYYEEGCMWNMEYNTNFGYVSESALGPNKTKETLDRVGWYSIQQSGFQIPNLNSNCSPYVRSYFIAN